VPEARFVIAGADNSRSDGFQRRMGATYQTHFLRRHPSAARAVKFVGTVSDQRLSDLYAACDLFVAPSLYESFGLIYLEAMNYGKAVVGCRAGGIAEVVEHGQTGLLVEPEAPAALAEAIVALLRSPERLRSFGLAVALGSSSASRTARWRSASRDLYREVIRRWGGRAPTGEVIH
jgi:glycosyltransferase involved in cell wall biosynthesis